MNLSERIFVVLEHYGMNRSKRDNLVAEVAQLGEENEAWRRYANHTYLCAHNANEKCDCGFDDLLTEEESG